MTRAIAGSLVLLLLAPSAARAVDLGTHLSYRGSVAKLSKEGTPGEAEKTFDLQIWAVAAEGGQTTLVWLLDESGRGGWSWMNRFGTWNVDGQYATSGTGPALLYDRDGRESVLDVPCPFVKAPIELKPEATWEQGRTRYVVTEQRELEGQPCWRIRVSNELGRKRIVWLPKADDAVVGIDERIFMGQGEEYELQLRLAGQATLTADEARQRHADAQALVDLRQALGRGVRSDSDGLTPKEREVLAKRLPDLRKAIPHGPLAAIVAAAARELETEAGKADRLAELAAKHRGKEIESFELAGLEGASLSDAACRGRVTVLHFWEYRDDPLKEPYGQIGYLDFLFDKRRGRGVAVYGVAVDSRLSDGATRPAATRSARKLVSFMNLSYPILLDNGDVLQKFGDPRLAGGRLPLFVLIDGNGKIAHYNVGCYEVDRDAGLKALDDAITAALSTTKP